MTKMQNIIKTKNNEIFKWMNLCWIFCIYNAIGLKCSIHISFGIFLDLKLFLVECYVTFILYASSLATERSLWLVILWTRPLFEKLLHAFQISICISISSICANISISSSKFLSNSRHEHRQYIFFVEYSSVPRLYFFFKLTFIALFVDFSIWRSLLIFEGNYSRYW